MISDEGIEKLNLLDEALFGTRSKNLLSPYSTPFDVSRPNIHDNKAEFLKEFSTVVAILEHCEGIIAALVAPNGDVSPEHQAMTDRLAVAINVSGLESRSRTSVYTATHLIMRNVIETGLHHNFMQVVTLARNGYRERFQELSRQEEAFWSVAHRPPNYYARTIALRFAKRFGKMRNIKPTFGTTSDSNHPSTDYGRALEEVFEILGIKSNVRKAAEWAIAQLKDEDWQAPPQNVLAGLFNYDPEQSS